MGRRAFSTATIISASLLAVTLALFIAGYVFTPWDYAISLSNSLHIGVWTQGIDSRVIFFNDREYGPYCGSIIGLVDEDGNVYPPLKREVAWGGSWGVYYRYFQWPDEATLWTLMVSLWYPIGFFAIMPLVWLLCRRFRGPASAR